MSTEPAIKSTKPKVSWSASSEYALAPANWNYPLGATKTSAGVVFSFFSQHAEAVEVCIERAAGSWDRFQLHGPHNGIWCGLVPNTGAGTVYGFRTYGPWDPNQGHLFNPQKLLLDPYAKALTGQMKLGPQIYAHQVNDDLTPTGYPLVRSEVDSAPYVPKAVVLGDSFPLAARPNVPWEKTVIYEMHVKGFSALNHQLPPELRGTYAGLAHDTSLRYLRDLGVTSIELLPIHAKCDETFLQERGLTNYWGYSTLGYFTPEPSYATAAAQAAGPQAVIDEFRGMVSRIHEAGLEVILDVVYNHTCEGSAIGPSLSWRGADNAAYYLSVPEDRGTLADVTGCGNSLDFTHPRVVQMTLDSLRYWVEEMGVDGFRFDLGVTLARAHGAFNRQHPFLVAAAADPVLSQVKLIMEPWDIGFDGWHTGDFPVPFAAWNDRFRGSMRDFWVANAKDLAHGNNQIAGQSELATRLAGSADVFYHDPNGVIRTPLAGINFITAHDGFTMADLVSYDHKHNSANQEDNRDGSDDNRSWNHGAEGSLSDLGPNPSTVAESGLVDVILPARERTIRNLFAMLLLSAGVPMITAGDEFARTQHGNNNAYCQDNEISWIDWAISPWQVNLREMVRYLLRLREKYEVMRPNYFASGQALTDHAKHPDLDWFDKEGRHLEPTTWNDPRARVLQMHRCGGTGHDLLLVINGTLNPEQVKLAAGREHTYRLVWDSTWQHPHDGGFNADGSISGPVLEVQRLEEFSLEPLSLAVFLS
ncbi:glycogen debranching protein GlgX [Boudabousia tangfeifanii]|uniref:glycogen debranching protein GlgX n=1 Tax=Boudabousia tangfeifanii TaxID=1912795 RepID=UPI0009F1A79B|nr:glycogen debranching protein GlgX [Boudabousia tangfeifanii]